MEDIIKFINEYILGRKSYNTIVKSFDKVHNDLHKLEARNRKAVVKHNEAIERMHSQKNALHSEAERASRVRGNLAQLLEK